MGTAEQSSSNLGPRYAPDDPTLPEPWKGLIDGSTGLLYYWNPETNVTQYERPASLPPPLQTGSLPTGNTPRQKNLPEARSQSESIQTLHHQQVTNIPFSQGNFMSSSSQQLPEGAQWASQRVGPARQLHGPHLGNSVPSAHVAPEQLRPEMVQQLPQQFSSQMGQMPLQQGHSVVQHPVQQGQQAPHQPVQQGQTAILHPVQQGQQAPHQPVQPISHAQQGPVAAPTGASLGFQYMPQSTQHLMHQHPMAMQGPQSSLQPFQHLTQGQQLPPKHENKVVPGPKHDAEFNQGGADFRHPFQEQQFSQGREIKVGASTKDSVEFQQLRKHGLSPSQIQQPGSSYHTNLPLETHSSRAQELSFPPSQNIAHGGASINMQHRNPSAEVHLGGEELMHRDHGSGFQNRMASGMTYGPPQNRPNMPYEENHLGRPGNDYLTNNARDFSAIPHQLPKLAPLPMPRKHLEMRTGDPSSQNSLPAVQGGMNDPAGFPFHNTYGQSSGALHYPSTRPPLAVMGPSDPIDMSAAEFYRQKHEVTATGDNVPAPFMTFEAAGLPPEILQEIRFAGFPSPTPIQAQTWPIALQNRDIVAIAKTGSGKTLGYLIPAFIHLRRRHNNPLNGPSVLVLAPTRELATQIQDEAIKFGRSSRVSCTCLYGGAPKGPQLRELERGADIVVATPGRLNDILEMKKVDFRQVSLLVLDEADRMLDMGFEPQIRKIVDEIPPRRQTLMYTATWPKDVRKIASDLLVNPVQVNIGSVDELAANKSITQHVEVVPEMEKQRRLEQILRSQEHGSKVIIFCSTKKLCDHLARSLGRYFGALAIHGDKSQGERDWVLNQFRSGKSQVLVATDVAARGLDIRDIRVVINYDFPTGIEDYIHRIGRTGRAGATGMSYTFFSEQDWKYAPDLVKLLEGANQVVPPEIRNIALRGGPSFGRERGSNSRWDPPADRGGMRDEGFGGRGRGGRGGMRDDGFGGRGGMRDNGHSGRGGTGDGGFRGRGGFGDGGFRGRGGFSGRGGIRDGNFSGGRDVNFSNFSGGRGQHDRFNDVRGRGRGRGRRDGSDRSPGRVRTWGRSRSRSRSSSRSRSRSRRRSYSRSRSRSRSWSRSRSRSPERYVRKPRKTKFDVMEVPAETLPGTGTGTGIDPSSNP